MTRHPGRSHHLPEVEDYDLPAPPDRPLWKDLLILAAMATAVLAVALLAGWSGVP